MADVADITPPAKSGPSLVIQLAVFLLLTIAAAGMGWVSAGFLKSDAPAAEEAAAGPAGGHEAAATGHGEATEGGEGEHGAEAPANPLLIVLPPITTNLAAPTDMWVRMELELVLDKPASDPHLGETIHQDLLAYMRTVKMHQVEGASGFQHLKTDMLERASVRSEGLVKMVLIKTLIFE